MKLQGFASGMAAVAAGMLICSITHAATSSPNGIATKTGVDCSAAYPGKHADCVQVACGTTYKPFLGTWHGKFHAYVREQSSPGHAVFRPYDESVAYGNEDCLRNAANGDTFIVGHETSRYPAFGKLPVKVEKDLLITGRHADGTPYLRTVRSDGIYDYRLTFQDKPAGLSIWSLRLPAANGQPPMTFTTIDMRDLDARSQPRRNVTVTMQVGSTQAPYWQGVIAYGWHVRS